MSRSEQQLTDGQQTDWPVDRLEPHPRNQEIYTNPNITVLVEDIDRHGFKEEHRLLVTPDEQILSGHRRWRAAKKVGLETVPIEVVGVDNEQEALFRLLLANQYRDKTPAEQINEAEAWREYYKIERNHNRGSGKSIDKIVADKVEISHNTISKGRKIKEIATGKRRAPEAVRKEAKRQWTAMQKNGERSQSIDGAYKQVQIIEADIETTKQRSVSVTKKPVVKKQDAVDFLEQVSDVNLLLTDPPYSTDIDDIRAFVTRWLPPAIDLITPGACGFIFVGQYSDELHAYLSVLGELGVRDRTQILVWEYKNTLGQTPKTQYKSNWQACLFIQSNPPTELDSPQTREQWAVQSVSAPDARFESRYHQWQKPDELLGRFIRHTTNRGDFVVDPFVGTGSTVLKAAELGRETLGCDTSEEMLEIAEGRGCVIDE